MSNFEDFSHFFRNPEFSDIIIVAEDHEFRAHRMILAKWSPVFHSMLSSDMAEQETRKVHLTGKSTESAKLFLEYLYCPVMRTVTDDNVQALLQLGHEYDVKEMVHACEMFLVSQLTSANATQYLPVAARFGLAHLTRECDRELAEQKFDTATVFQSLALANQYNLSAFSKACLEFAATHAQNIVHTQVYDLSCENLTTYLNNFHGSSGEKVAIIAAWAKQPLATDAAAAAPTAHSPPHSPKYHHHHHHHQDTKAPPPLSSTDSHAGHAGHAGLDSHELAPLAAACSAPAPTSHSTTPATADDCVGSLASHSSSPSYSSSSSFSSTTNTPVAAAATDTSIQTNTNNTTRPPSCTNSSICNTCPNSKHASRVRALPTILSEVLQLNTAGHLLSSDVLDKIRDIDAGGGSAWVGVRAELMEWLVASWRQKFKTLETSSNDLQDRVNKVKVLVDDHQKVPVGSVFRPTGDGLYGLDNAATHNYKLLEWTNVLNS
mmetsp:Transcript_50949/g.99902  ORF Transcript_50949/g.99902 Transcript_50949/m.99902 type:complete len:491 (-) Transcript_50949:188-1660(-)